MESKGIVDQINHDYKQRLLFMNPATELIKQNQSLAAAMLQQSMAQGQTPFLTVTSDSMAPLLKTGDQIGLEPTAVSQLRPGDIITLAPKGDILTHRFWSLEMGQIRTRGDRLLLFDPLWPPDCLLGRVIVRRRNGRSLSFTSGRGQRLNRHLARLTQIENRLIPNKSLVRLFHRAVLVWARFIIAITD